MRLVILMALAIVSVLASETEDLKACIDREGIYYQEHLFSYEYLKELTDEYREILNSPSKSFDHREKFENFERQFNKSGLPFEEFTARELTDLQEWYTENYNKYIACQQALSQLEQKPPL